MSVEFDHVVIHVDDRTSCNRFYSPTGRCVASALAVGEPSVYCCDPSGNGIELIAYDRYKGPVDLR